MASVALPSSATGLRTFSYNYEKPPPLPPRRKSVALPAPLKLQSVTQSGGMESRYYRPSSPRSRHVNPARSSTGTFNDPYYDSSYYGRQTSPRTSGERVSGSHHPTYTYAPSSSSGSRSANLKYDSYSGRPRRNTLNESDDRLVRPNVREIVPAAALAHRAPGVHHHHSDRPSSPLARSWDTRGDTYSSQAPKREHKRIYSVDNDSHKTKLVAEREIVESPRSVEPRGYSLSEARPYQSSSSKPSSRKYDLGDEGYSYTDAAGMYRDTEPAWRRPRSGSMERKPRPSSMLLDNRSRQLTRESGPPPSTRGFDKINGYRDHHARSSSVERSREVPRYDPYPETAATRAPSSRHKPTVHQEPRDSRRDTYHDDYSRRDRDVDRRRDTAERFEDRDVPARGFGIAAQGPPALAQDLHLDRQPIRAQEIPRARPEEYAAKYYAPERADVRVPEPRGSRDHIVPTYEERPRDRDRDRDRERERDRDRRDGTSPPGAVPIAAVGAAAGAAATYGAAKAIKSRDRDRDQDYDKDRERERELEREREKRREWDERDRRDRVADDRRDRTERNVDDRKDSALDERMPPAAAAYAPAPEEHQVRDPRYEDEDKERRSKDRRREAEERDRRSRKAPSSDGGSADERPHHYPDRDSARESERRSAPAPAPKEPALDPDEEYRRRIQQEAERVGRGGRDRDSDSDKERERRRRKEERDRSRDRAIAGRSRGSPSSNSDSSHPRYDDRSSSIIDKDHKFIREPEPMDAASEREPPSRSVTIVEPPKEAAPAPKGILRKPTEKFPEDPDPIREGVAPHKSALKGKDIPVGARWTKIDRRLVNPQALDEAKERFEERMDCVIVLRVLTKEEIQKLADRTKIIREKREDDFPDDDDDDRRERDRDRRHRGHHDDEDRDRERERDRDRDRDRERERDRERRREYSDEEDIGRERDRPRMIESGR